MKTTLTKPKLEAEVENLGKIYRVDIPFDQALESLREFGIETPISSRDLAYARVKEGINSSLSGHGNYTREGFLYLRNEPVLLASNSPLLDIELARQAVKSNRNRNYFSIERRVYDEKREIAEGEKTKVPEERTLLILPKKGDYIIPTNRFNENELTRFLFKDQAENYGDFLKENKINEMPVWLVDKGYVDNRRENAILLIQLGLLSLIQDRSGVSGGGRGLGYGYRVRGVFEKTGEAGRVLENPTPEQK